MSEAVAQPVSARPHLWLAAGCAVMALVSPDKFHGMPSWLGAFGWFGLSALLAFNPYLATTKPRFTSHPKTSLAAMAVSLLLIVSSVVIWSLER